MFFWNPAGSGRLFDVAYALGLDFADDGRSFAPVDIDGDGDLDLATASLQQLRLMENRGDPGTFARVRLKATKTQHHALGATVIVSAGGVQQMDYVKATAGFQTQVPLELHFGLGGATVIDRLTVRWPSGAEQEFEGLPAGGLITVVEGQAPTTSPVPAWAASSRPKVGAGFSLALDAPTVEGHRARLAKAGKPVVLNFWAPWCKPCMTELPDLAKASLQHRGAVRFVGVSVETKDTAAVASAIDRFGLGYPQFYSDDAVMTSFFGGDGEAPLPSTFVFDAQGQLVRAFYRAVSAADLDGVLAPLRAEGTNAELALQLGEGLLMRGDLAGARRALERSLAADPESVFALIAMGTLLSKEGESAAAKVMLERAVAADRDLPQAHFALGVACNEAGETAAAVAAFEQAVSIKPDSVKFLNSLGAAQARAGDHAAARQTFERVVAVDPKSVKGWLNLATTKLNLHDRSGPEDLRRVLELDPDNAAAKALLGQLGLR